MGEFFEGWYFRHQNSRQTLALIPGIAGGSPFIQVVTDRKSFWIPFEKEDFRREKGRVWIEKNHFSAHGILLDIDRTDVRINGWIAYDQLTPPAYDVMGPFVLFSMQCRHGVISMYHRLKGRVTVNGTVFDFSGGTGYIEKDSGRSFPKNYIWIQANDFPETCSIMAAVAHVPFLGTGFLGTLALIWYRGKEYRIASYNGGQALLCSERRLVTARPGYRLEITLPPAGGHLLRAPNEGSMCRSIRELPAIPASFRFFGPEGEIFHMTARRAAYERVCDIQNDKS